MQDSVLDGCSFRYPYTSRNTDDTISWNSFNFETFISRERVQLPTKYLAVENFADNIT